MTRIGMNPLEVLLEDETLQAILEAFDFGANAPEPEPDPWPEDFVSIEHVIFNDPATIVFWSDGTKTKVQARGGDKFSRQTGLLMCIAKKVFGNDGSWYDELRHWDAVEEQPRFFGSSKGNGEATAKQRRSNGEAKPKRTRKS